MELKNLLEQTRNLNWVEKLKFIANHQRKAAFSTSFSIEDQIITDVIFKNNLNIEVFTVDSGRLPNETHIVWQETLNKYGKKIKAFHPDAKAISEFVEKNGINPFYESVEMRHACCHIRKVEPLKIALKDQELWISGVRREHNLNRQDKDFFEFDSVNPHVMKFYPILDLIESEVWSYIKENNIPYNKLYDQGYKSIGCDPCSRAVSEGEDARAGRWWWENEGDKECGLHMANGKLVRVKKDQNQ